MQESDEMHVLLSKQIKIIAKQICFLISIFPSRDVFNYSSCILLKHLGTLEPYFQILNREK